MKLLSYSFFEPKSLAPMAVNAVPQHRNWDKYKKEINRYYYNVPGLILTNYLLYPDYTTKIHITPNVRNNPLWGIFELLGEYNLSIEEIDIDYKLTEPAIFRMSPLWDEKVSIFHTKDIDSLPTLAEYQYSKCFELSDASVGTMRSHPTHNSYGCRMLAGLSSFKPFSVPQYIKGNSFLDYFNRSHGKWCCDQELMVRTFTCNPDYTKENFYDCMSHQQHDYQGFPCKVCSLEQLSSIELSPWAKIIFPKISECGFDNWAGEPIDCRGPYLNFILEAFPSVCVKIQNDLHLRNFYRL